MADRERIEGWKAIASHFNRGVRTVQRWERELGLPVRRRGTGRGEVVFAYVDELDAWFARSDPPPAPPPGQQSPTARIDDPAVTGPPFDRSPRPARRRIALALIIVGGAATALWLLASWRQAQGGPGADVRGPNPVGARVENDAIVAVGADGSVLWSRRFGIELDEGLYPAVETVGRSLIVVKDIDSDGKNEVLVGVQRGVALAEAEGLYVFNSDGSRRFHYRPIHRVQFGPYRGAPPWLPSLIAVQPSNGSVKSIWLASATSYYPSVLERIGPDGRPEAAYWSDGYVTTVRFATLDGRAVVLVGSDNNEWHGGSLAVLDPASPAATAPALNPDYRCTAGCSTAEPLAFVTWPGSPMHRALGGTEPVWGQINVLDDGQIQVTTGRPGGWSSAAAPNALPLSSNRLYVLDSHLRLVSAELTTGYRRAYEHVRSLIGLPPFDPRPEHHLYPMLRWEGGRFVRIDHPEVGVLAGRPSR